MFILIIIYKKQNLAKTPSNCLLKTFSNFSDTLNLSSSSEIINNNSPLLDPKHKEKVMLVKDFSRTAMDSIKDFHTVDTGDSKNRGLYYLKNNEEYKKSYFSKKRE